MEPPVSPQASRKASGFDASTRRNNRRQSMFHSNSVAVELLPGSLRRSSTCSVEERDGSKRSDYGSKQSGYGDDSDDNRSPSLGSSAPFRRGSHLADPGPAIKSLRKTQSLVSLRDAFSDLDDDNAEIEYNDKPIEIKSAAETRAFNAAAKRNARRQTTVGNHTVGLQALSCDVEPLAKHLDGTPLTGSLDSMPGSSLQDLSFISGIPEDGEFSEDGSDVSEMFDGNCLSRQETNEFEAEDGPQFRLPSSKNGGGFANHSNSIADGAFLKSALKGTNARLTVADANGSRPTTAGSRPTTADGSSRPTTASSRPATAGSRPSTPGWNRPTTPGSRPTTAEKPARQGARPSHLGVNEEWPPPMAAVAEDGRGQFIVDEAQQEELHRSRKAASLTAKESNYVRPRMSMIKRPVKSQEKKTTEEPIEKLPPDRTPSRFGTSMGVFKGFPNFRNSREYYRKRKEETVRRTSISVQSVASAEEIASPYPDTGAREPPASQSHLREIPKRPAWYVVKGIGPTSPPKPPPVAAPTATIRTQPPSPNAANLPPSPYGAPNNMLLVVEELEDSDTDSELSFDSECELPPDLDDVKRGARVALTPFSKDGTGLMVFAAKDLKGSSSAPAKITSGGRGSQQEGGSNIFGFLRGDTAYEGKEEQPSPRKEPIMVTVQGHIQGPVEVKCKEALTLAYVQKAIRKELVLNVSEEYQIFDSVGKRLQTNVELNQSVQENKLPLSAAWSFGPCVGAWGAKKPAKVSDERLERLKNMPVPSLPKDLQVLLTKTFGASVSKLMGSPWVAKPEPVPVIETAAEQARRFRRGSDGDGSSASSENQSARTSRVPTM